MNYLDLWWYICWKKIHFRVLDYEHYVGLLFNKFLRDNILNKKIACNDINHGCVIVNVTKINIRYIQSLHVSRCAYALFEEKCDFIN